MVSTAQSWSRVASLPYILLSFLIVTFGQPAWLPWLGLIASVCGFALFWKGMLCFRRQSSRFILSMAWFTAVQLVQLSWMTSDRYHGTYIWFVWLFFSALLGFQFGVLSFFIRPAIRLTLLRTLAVPAVWTLMEWARIFLFTAGFTWNPVGLAETGYVLPALWASVVGIYGLSFWVMLVNILVLQLLLVAKDRRRWVWAGAMAVLPYAFGLASWAYHSPRIEHTVAEPISAILVQTGLEPGERTHVNIGARDTVAPLNQWARIYAMVTRHQGKPVDLIVMPEGTVPLRAGQMAYSGVAADRLVSHFFGPTHEAPLPHFSNRDFAAKLADEFQANVIVGLDDEQGECLYNAALCFHPYGDAVEAHHKRVLVPIAESLPYDWLRSIAHKYGIMNECTAGTSPTVFEGPVRAGAIICYEETFSHLVREARRGGAEVLVSLSTDGWYPDSRLAMQHFTHGRVRAIENGAPLFRSCHTGVTVAIDSLGRTVAQVGDPKGQPEHLADALYVQVPRYSYTTLYTLVGDGLAVGFSALVAAGFIAFRRK